MQDKLVVTIVDESGSRQFNLPKSATKIILAISGILIILIILSVLLMRFLMQKIDDIALNKDIALSEYKYIYYQNDYLKEQIKQKSQELNIVGKKIGNLENIIQTKKSTAKSNHEHINLTQITPAEKTLMLNLIPNGEPLKSYISKTDTAQREHPVKKIKGIASGIDFSAPLDTPVYATADGVVDLVRNGYDKGYGNFVKLAHSFGFSSSYSHLQKAIVKKGDFVQKGQLIGYSGKSGDSNGETLHYEVRFLGKILDPGVYTQWNASNFDGVFDNDSSIDWKSLVWAIQDIAILQKYKLTQNEDYSSIGKKK